MTGLHKETQAYRLTYRPIPPLPHQLMADQQDITIILPDLLRSWPWPRNIHPDYDAIKEESAVWWNSLEVMTVRMHHIREKSGIALLAGLAYNTLDRDACRIGSDLMGVFFVIDEETDALDGIAARSYADMIMDALHHPFILRPAGEWIGGEVTRLFWERVVKIATPTAQEHFVTSFQNYMDAIVLEATHRTEEHICDLRTYFEVRRDTIGSAPSFAIGRIYFNIPSEILAHPVINKLTEIATDMLIIGNDICSYKCEWERGDGSHNSIMVVMKEFSMDAQSAINWISRLHDSLMVAFLKQWYEIPTFGGPLDREVRAYCDTIGNWVRASEVWSVECKRYFGQDGPKLMQTRVVSISSMRREQALRRLAKGV